MKSYVFVSAFSGEEGVGSIFSFTDEPTGDRFSFDIVARRMSVSIDSYSRRLGNDDR